MLALSALSLMTAASSQTQYVSRERAIETARDFCEFAIKGINPPGGDGQTLPGVTNFEFSNIYGIKPIYKIHFGDYRVVVQAVSGKILDYNGDRINAEIDPNRTIDLDKVKKVVKATMNAAGYSGDVTISGLYLFGTAGNVIGHYGRVSNGIESALECFCQFEANFVTGHVTDISFRDQSEDLPPPTKTIDLDVARDQILVRILNSTVHSSYAGNVPMQQAVESSTYPLKLRKWHPYDVSKGWTNGYTSVLQLTRNPQLVYDGLFYARGRQQDYMWYVVLDLNGNVLGVRGDNYATIGRVENYFEHTYERLESASRVIVKALNEIRRFATPRLKKFNGRRPQGSHIAVDLVCGDQLYRCAYFSDSNLINTRLSGEPLFYKPSGDLQKFLEKKSRIAKRIKEGKPV